MTRETNSIEPAGQARRRPAARAALALAAILALLCLAAGSAAADGPFEIPSFVGPALNEDGTSSVEAGGRPFEQLNVFTVETDKDPVGPNAPYPAGSLKDVEVDLPPGIVGNAASFPKCTQEEMDQLPTDCPNKAQIGYVHLKLRWGVVGPKGWQIWSRPVYNMVPPLGDAAQFAFRTLIATVHIDFHIRTGSDYGVTAVIHNSNATAPVLASDLRIWGLPADPSHDHLRVTNASINAGDEVAPYPEPPPFLALLSNPTSCRVPLVTEMRARSWQNPDQTISTAPSVAPKMADCGNLEFNPSVEAKPSTDRGDSPSGLDFHLHIPQQNAYIGERAANEVQALRVQANRGQFKLTFNGETTPDIPFNASYQQLQGTLEGLGTIGAGNVFVSAGGPGNKGGTKPYIIQFQAGLGRQDVEPLVVEDGTEPLGIFSESGLAPGIATVTTPTPGASGFAISGNQAAMLRESKVVLPPSLTVNPSSANGRGSCSVSQIGYLGQGPEKQTFTYERGVTDTFTLTFKGQTTGRLPGEATPAQVLAALQGLPGLAGNVSVTGSPGGFTVTFGGALAGTDVPPLAGTTYSNPSQTLAVTGEEGGYNLAFEGASTGKTLEASYGANEGFFFYTNTSKEPEAGEPLLGPGIAPGTVITFSSGYPGGVAGLNHNTTAAGTAATLHTGIPFDATAEQVEEMLRTVPALDRNAFVKQLGISGDTRTYRVVLGNEFTGTQPPLLTSTDGLAGAGAGVTITAEPAAAPQPLEVVTSQEAGMPQFTPDAANCPEDSNLGTVRIDSPAVIDHPLEGNVYLATPHENPFGSLLAMYITVNDPKSGVVVKLPGRIDADPQTGQLTATVSEAPQLPFEDLTLSFFKGATAPLKTGLVCGNSAVQTDMVPWSAPEGVTTHPGSSFTVSQACAPSEGAAPNTRSFEAGTQNPVAGAYSPFTLKLSRPDGSQQLSGLEATLPKGLLAKLAGVPYCSDAALAAAAAKAGRAEQAAPSCPAASRVGSVTVGAGAGPTPFYAQGSAYLAGPYKGAPLSIAVITPAVAGPFDLGTVVVRNALQLDPLSAQVRVVSDPFPTILEGIPLDLRSIVVTLDKSQFTKNPTNCAASTIGGATLSTTGQASPLSQHFQVGDCGLLGFKPKLALSFKGQTNRTGNPAVTALLTQPEGQSGIAGVEVLLPRTEFIDNAHVKNPCTRVQFNADACPANSVLGSATAYSPLLEKPLTGPVYFRSNGGERKLPDIVADLNGQIHVVLVGFIDSVHIKGTESSRIRTRFLNVPDAPVSKFELALLGGKKGLIENTKNLCSQSSQADALIDGQNGKSFEAKVPIKTSCKQTKHKSAKGKKNQGGSGKKKGKGKKHAKPQASQGHGK